MADICPECERPVRKRQHGVTCDMCDKWHHRTCNTGISRAEYYSAIKGNIDLSFTCKSCRPTTGTTDLSNDSSANTSGHVTDVSTNDRKKDTYSSIYDELPPVSPTLVIDFDFNDDSDTDDDNFSGVNHNTATDRDGIFDIIHETPAHVTVNVVPNGTQEEPGKSDTILEEVAIHDTVQDEVASSDTILEDVARTYDNEEIGCIHQKKTLVSSDGHSYCVKVS